MEIETKILGYQETKELEILKREISEMREQIRNLSKSLEPLDVIG